MSRRERPAVRARAAAVIFSTLRTADRRTPVFVCEGQGQAIPRGILDSILMPRLSAYCVVFRGKPSCIRIEDPDPQGGFQSGSRR